jgi:hypothetical protein
VALLGLLPAGFAGYYWQWKNGETEKQAVAQEQRSLALRAGSPMLHTAASSLWSVPVEAREQAGTALRTELARLHRDDALAAAVAEAKSELAGLQNAQRSAETPYRESDLVNELDGVLDARQIDNSLAQWNALGTLRAVPFGPLDQGTLAQLSTLSASAPKEFATVVRKWAETLEKWTASKGVTLNPNPTTP